MRFISLVIGAVCLTSTLHAAIFTIGQGSTDLAGGTANPIYQAFDSAARQIETEVNDNALSLTKRQTLSDGIGKAATSSISSLIIDRTSSENTEFAFGFGAQASANLNGQSFDSISRISDNQLPAVGAAAQVSLLFGTKATKLGLFEATDGFIKGERLMLYGSLFYFSTSVSTLKFNFFNIGANAKYQLVEGAGYGGLASWGGVFISSGLTFATNTFTYAGRITQSKNQSITGGGGTSATMQATLNYDLGARSTNFLVPIEISTNVQLLYLLSLYVGGSMDLNFGSAGLVGTASGPVTATTDAATGGASNVYSATATLNMDDGTKGGTSFLAFRGFVGAQLNFSVLKLLVEGGALSNGSTSVAAILRVIL